MVDLFGLKRRDRELASLQSSLAIVVHREAAVRREYDLLLQGLAEAKDEEVGKSLPEYRGSNVAREKLAALWQMWAMDPVCFGGVNAVAYLGTCVNHTLEGKVRDVEEVKAFQKRIRWPDWLYESFTHQQVCGCHFNEIVLNKAKNAISVLKTIDAVDMDFDKTKEGDKVFINMDSWGRPAGYWQRPYDWDGQDLKAGTHLNPNQVMHIVMRKISDSIYGLGVIEPIKKITIIKMNIEDAFGEAMHRVGFPVPITYCGSEKVPPTNAGMLKTHAMMKKFHSKSAVTLPYYNKVDIPSPRVEGIPANLDYFVTMQCAAIGVAKAVVLGTGEGTNRATLDQLTEEGAKNITTMHRKIAANLEDKVFTQMIELGQLKDEVHVIFDPVKTEDKLALTQEVVDLVATGILTPEDQLEVFMRQKLGLPPRTGPYNPQAPQSPPGGAAFSAEEAAKTLRRGY